MNARPFDPAEDDEGPGFDDLDLGDAASCDGCGCTALDPCPGGCVWASENLCSRCA